MTKSELERDRDEWKQQAESLQDDLDSLNEYVTELEMEIAELSNKTYGIQDIDDFKFRLLSCDLLTQELEDFLEDYIKFRTDK